MLSWHGHITQIHFSNNALYVNLIHYLRGFITLFIRGFIISWGEILRGAYVSLSKRYCFRAVGIILNYHETSLSFCIPCCWPLSIFVSITLLLWAWHSNSINQMMYPFFSHKVLSCEVSATSVFLNVLPFIILLDLCILAEFSEALREMGTCLLEKTALNDDEESG